MCGAAHVAAVTRCLNEMSPDEMTVPNQTTPSVNREPHAHPPVHTPSSLLDAVDVAPLFTPFSVGDLTLVNRFVMAPMTRSKSPGGVPGADVAAYYARRAAQVGLIITEGTYVDHPAAGSSDRVPRFYGDDALAGWAAVVAAVHAVGGRIMPQLWHIGATRAAGTPPHPDAPTLSPSGITLDGSTVGAAATQVELNDLIAGFARSARAAQRLGFDGVEVHGAHGYLLDQFFWSATNRRTDAYGGTPENRSRLSAEIVAAMRREVGPTFPIVFRFSQWKVRQYEARSFETPQELERMLRPLTDAGVSMFHVSTRRYWLPGFVGSARTLAGWTKHVSGLPTIAIGSVGVDVPFLGQGEDASTSLSLAPLLELFGAGEFDLVAVGRALISEPNWVGTLRSGQVQQIRAYEKVHEQTLD